MKDETEELIRTLRAFAETRVSMEEEIWLLGAAEVIESNPLEWSKLRESERPESGRDQA